MNPEPPPIADPHSTAPVQPETAPPTVPVQPETVPRTPGTIFLALLNVMMGVPLLVGGVSLATNFFYPKTRLPNPVELGLVTLLVCGGGLILVWQGWRYWKDGH